VSLILEALRKLERDKDAPERGFVVMTHVPWAQGGRGRSRLVGIAVLALAVAAGALAMALWRGASGKPAGPDAKSASPSPLPPSGAITSGPASPRPAFEAKALAIETLGRVVATAPVSPSPTSATSSAAPTPPQPPATSDLRLHAISRQDNQPVAVLNDRLVREGDAFDGIRVIRIGETEVEVEVRGQRRILTF
jgi:hypothetical protein